MSWSWTAWVVSVSAVLISGGLAWAQGNLRKRPGLDMGFVNHGGMWGDLLLLPIANAAIVPYLQPGTWILASLAICALLSAWVHVHWYRGDRPGAHSREHMWPSRPRGSWWKDLSWAGWAHVVYVACELTVLAGFLLFPMPDEAIALVCVIFSLHLPLGLLQPRWFLIGEIASILTQPLLAPSLGVLWTVAWLKL